MSVKRYELTTEHCFPWGEFMCEDAEGDYVLHSDYAALLARHSALWNFYNQLESAMYEYEKEARVERMKRVAAERFAARYKEIATTAVARHNALREAVEWEREFDEVLVWLVQTGRYPRDMAGKYDLANERECARAEVDRLIANESAADCKGEG